MKYFVLLCVALLTGCVTYMAPNTYAVATTWCEGHQGLQRAGVEVYSRDTYALYAVCNDGVEMERKLGGKP